MNSHSSEGAPLLNYSFQFSISGALHKFHLVIYTLDWKVENKFVMATLDSEIMNRRWKATSEFFP